MTCRTGGSQLRSAKVKEKRDDVIYPKKHFCAKKEMRETFDKFQNSPSLFHKNQQSSYAKPKQNFDDILTNFGILSN